MLEWLDGEKWWEKTVVGAVGAMLGILGMQAKVWLQTRMAKGKEARERREAVRERIREEVAGLSNALQKYWCADDLCMVDGDILSSQIAQHQTYLADQIWSWTETCGEEESDGIRKAFQKLVFHATGGHLHSGNRQRDHGRAVRTSQAAGALLSRIDAAK